MTATLNEPARWDEVPAAGVPTTYWAHVRACGWDVCTSLLGIYLLSHRTDGDAVTGLSKITVLRHLKATPAELTAAVDALVRDGFARSIDLDSGIAQLSWNAIVGGLRS